MDVSETAILAAQKFHSGISFSVSDLMQQSTGAVGRFDLVILKDSLWYVLPGLRSFWKTLSDCYDPAAAFS